MDTNEIRQILQSDVYTASIFADCLPIDWIPNPLPEGRLWVINLGDSNTDGFHWCSLSTLEAPESVFWFNPLGDPPPQKIIPKLLSAASRIYYADIPLQSISTVTCGHLSTLMCLFLARSETPLEALSHFPTPDSQPYLTVDFFAHQIISALTDLRDKSLINWELFKEP